MIGRTVGDNDYPHLTIDKHQLGAKNSPLQDSKIAGQPQGGARFFSAGISGMVNFTVPTSQSLPACACPIRAQ
jgi:hypothetical protein